MKIIYDIPTYNEKYKTKVSSIETHKKIETENIEEIIKLIKKPEITFIMIYKQ